MSRLHGLMVSLLLAACVVAGATAATNTVHIGQASSTAPRVPQAEISARVAKLDAFA